MNILASFSWIKEYADISVSAEVFARELALKSMSVESSKSLEELYHDMVIGEVLEVLPHPKADRLQIAKTDIGNEVVEVVCGGTNLAEGQRVVVALPGAEVRWHGEGDYVKLEKTAIRGVESYGMICAANEIGLEAYPQEDGEILDVTDLIETEAGMSAAEALDFKDTIFDIEITTNRPDAMGMIGLAREGAAAVGSEFHFPELPEIEAGEGKELKVTVDSPDLCPRYMAVVMDNVRVQPSPYWLQKKLLLAGKKPINNIVDITNYILLEFAQPMHAFDYEEIQGKEIHVRRAKDAEKLRILDGTEVEMHANNLVIADEKSPIALAGIMGGEHSGVHEDTKTIVLEAASFDPIFTRRSARSVNVYSDSQSLFEKGLSTETPEYALRRAVELVKELAGGTVASDVFDERETPYEEKVFDLDTNRVRKLLGVELEDKEQIAYLEALGFKVKKSGEDYHVTVPYWRDEDIESGIDFAEEIARLYGYHNILPILPQSAPPTKNDDADLKWEAWMKRYFSSIGYTELYGYSFTNADDLRRYDLPVEGAVQIHNPLSADASYMRTSLMVSLLRDVEQNQGEIRAARLFNIARVYDKQEGDLPREHTMCVVAEYGYEDAETAFLTLKGALENMFAYASIGLDLVREEDPHWHKTRSAAVYIGEQKIGMMGEVSAKYAKAFGLKVPVMVAELDGKMVTGVLQKIQSYEAIGAFPAITRDIAFMVDERVEYSEIEHMIGHQSPLIQYITLEEVYRGAPVEEGKKSMTLTIDMRADDRTLSSEEADQVMKKIEKELQEAFHAIIR